MLPVADTNPVTLMLPLDVLPTTLKFVKLPTCVRFEYKTFALNVFPVKSPAFALDAVTPVS